jgi:hypothetical protein
VLIARALACSSSRLLSRRLQRRSRASLTTVSMRSARPSLMVLLTARVLVEHVEGDQVAVPVDLCLKAAAAGRMGGPAWKADYRATRPKVERKIGHLMRRRHGGRRARVRGLVKVAADFSLLAAVVNLARRGRLGLASTAGRWTVATA